MTPGSAQWVALPRGTFDMGSPIGELGRVDNEVLHPVTLTRDFIILSTEVSQADYEARMGNNPSSFGTVEGGPVETVSWSDAASYCNALSGVEFVDHCYDCEVSQGTTSCEQRADYASIYDCPGYRLPTEAEWEYAARAGTPTATFDGDLIGNPNNPLQSQPALEDIAWWAYNSGNTTHAVATKNPSKWGLYDTSGNALELCHDWVAAYPTGAVTDPAGPSIALFRALRGGSGGLGAWRARAAWRGDAGPNEAHGYVGFRVARTMSF